MGYLRKMLSIGSTFATGVPVVQFRSDTERAARQTKLLRQDVARNSFSGPPMVMRQTTPAAKRASANRQSNNRAKRLSSLDDLQRLHTLLEQGVITEDEFAEAKSEIMRSL